MVCDNCRERDAVVHLTQVVEGAVTQVHLCEKCAADKGVETTVAAPKHSADRAPAGGAAAAGHGSVGSDALHVLSGHLQGFPRDRPPGLRALLHRVRAAACANCCGACMGDAAQSVVSTRRQRRTSCSGRPTVHELRERLRRAIELEQFEQAAALRDQLKEVAE